MCLSFSVKSNSNSQQQMQYVSTEEPFILDCNFLATNVAVFFSWIIIKHKTKTLIYFYLLQLSHIQIHSNNFNMFLLSSGKLYWNLQQENYCGSSSSVKSYLNSQQQLKHVSIIFS